MPRHIHKLQSLLWVVIDSFEEEAPHLHRRLRGAFPGPVWDGDKYVEPISAKALRSDPDEAVPFPGSDGYKYVEPILAEALRSDPDDRVRIKVARNLLRLNPLWTRTMIAALLEVAGDRNPEVRQAARDALLSHELGRVAEAVPFLLELMKEADAPEVRRRAIQAWKGVGEDLASAAVPALVEALGDKESSVRLESLSTLAWLGPEAARKAPHLVAVLLQDADEQVREQAARTLLWIAPEDDLFDRLRGVKDAGPRDKVLRILRKIGQEARPLRRKLEAAWEKEEETSAGDQREESPARGGASAPRFEQWAVGMEYNKKWHLFRVVRRKWQHCGPLKGLRGGLRAKLLEGFAANDGVLVKSQALKIAGGPAACADSETVMKKIKPELSALRGILREAVGVANSKEDPLPWDEPCDAWQARVQVGFAIQEDGQKLGGEGRLRFSLRSGLSPEENIDAGF
jgi:hypothetical protein